MPSPTSTVRQGFYYHGSPVPPEKYIHSPYGWQQLLPPQRTHAQSPLVMSKADILKKISVDTTSFFIIRSLDGAEKYISTLPQEYRFLLVNKFATQAVESEETDAQLVADFFACVRKKDLCSATLFEEGLTPLAKIIDSIGVDTAKPLYLFVIVVKGTGLHENEGCRARIAAQSMDSEKLLSLLAPNTGVLPAATGQRS
ncbi:hypothetical protein EWM64_g6250 [Hericium alpestre]|uniref:Uncharacterized protein n=1 Tax=Hericium alpestre TaxID=135208 RepID=A0A4Y9ZSB3_9AGAM|nr:hypothetical protein EWM64_g6250 [Hericium alpestre]